MSGSCGTGGSTTKLLVGLQRVGVTGLHDAFKAVEEAGLSEREEIASRLFDIVSGQNYVPESLLSCYRDALLREYLRYKGEDFREFYSEITVVVKGLPGQERERFVERVGSAFADFELKPVVRFEAPEEGVSEPRLVIDSETVIAGNVNRSAMKLAIKKRISDW